jgi:hypothetical protein
MVQWAHGVRAEGARQPEHPGRSAEPADAGGDEHQDQVSRGFPSVCAQCPARAGERLLRARLRFAVHAARGAGQEGEENRADGGAAEALGHRHAQRSEIGDSGRHACRLLGPSADRQPRNESRLLRPDPAFERRTGCAVLVNTSFNVRGEPVVCSPADAYRCFMRTDLDYLVLGPFLLDKEAQPEWKEEGDWRNEFQLD